MRLFFSFFFSPGFFGSFGSLSFPFFVLLPSPQSGSGRVGLVFFRASFSCLEGPLLPRTRTGYLIVG